MEIEFLKELNESQLEAVVNAEGPMMVIAGAGSGKTRVLTYRLAFTISQGLADPQELLALTFTNKAAREMKDRIYKLVGPEAKGIVMGTFHSIFARVLRTEAERMGYTRNFTIYDSDDSVSLIKILLKEQNLDDKLYKPRVIANLISSNKTRLILPAKFKEFVKTDFDEKAALIYELYEKRLKKANAMDFGDLLMKPLFLFHEQPDILAKYQNRFRFIMVDEYQDTNHVQYMLCKMLAAAHENICVVGDDAQSIYAFRGANIQNILNFKKDYPEAREVKLEQNYRSTKNIVDAANGIIAKNKDQIKKTVFTQNESGDLIQLLIASSEHEEAQLVTNSIREQRQMKTYHNRDFGILYRTNAQSRAIEDALRRANIPYRIYGGLSFYQRKEIKDIVAYLRLAINPVDEQALLRVINYPKRGVGKTSLNKMVVFADEKNLSLWDVFCNIDRIGMGGRVVTVVKDFASMIERFAVEAKNGDAYEAANFIAKESGMLKSLHNSEVPEDLSRWENVQELLNAAKEFTENPDHVNQDKLEHFLAEISLFTDADKNLDDDNVVNLMTIHSAKGLEFRSVFVVGMEEGIFPSSMAETRLELEEERRLFYVAITRAEESLTLSCAKSRYRYGQIQYNEPSRFVDEVDAKYMHVPSRKPVARHPLEPNARRKPANLRPLAETSRPRPLAPSSAPTALPDDFVASDPEKITTGMTVRHPKFGVGKVISMEMVGGQQKATVFFQGSGKKNLLLKYAKLMILG